MSSFISRHTLALVFSCFALLGSSAAAATISVSAGGDFQSVLDAAQPGDTILLAAGATFTGPFTLPVKSGVLPIVIRTSADDSQIPPSGTRINPSYAGVMPKLVAASNPVIIAAQGTHHYQFVGVEMMPRPGGFLYNVVLLGDGTETSTSQLPHDITLDRCYIHGDATLGSRRGIAMNGQNITVVDSYLADFKEAGHDSQAIACWNGPGPFQITNNYLEGAGENIMFGGTDPVIPNLVPSDVTITHNYIAKPQAWRGSGWTVKNLVELKNAQRVTIAGNVIEYNWAAAQNGFGILFTVRNQDGGAPWSVVQNVTFSNNIVRHVAAAINILGSDDIYPSQQTNNIQIVNNLFEDVSDVNWGGRGRLYQLLDGPANVVIDHNTAFETQSQAWADNIKRSGPVITGFIYRNNIAALDILGGGMGGGNSTLNAYFTSPLVTNNGSVGGNPSNYPPGNYFPVSMDSVGFVNLAGRDYHLNANSPYKNAGTDGKDLGADIDALNAATAGAVEGTSPPPPPPPGDAPAS